MNPPATVPPPDKEDLPRELPKPQQQVPSVQVSLPSISQSMPPPQQPHHHHHGAAPGLPSSMQQQMAMQQSRMVAAQQQQQQQFRPPFRPQQPSTFGSTAPYQPPAPIASSAAVDAQYRPLNVKDALSYLDQVKLQFSDQPDIYNRFLDIMKDFKSQAIDTPGVIERVSQLFRGHPALIVGFNTFLPPGYKIEISMGQAGTGQQNFYTVTTSTPESIIRYNVGGGPIPQKVPVAAQSNVLPKVQVQQPVQQQPAQMQPKKPVEFNHAINYVNKIKTRYANEPEIYKQFLEILRTYQNDSKPIAEVYAQVHGLFKNSPDLLEEFKQFLPDTSQQQQPARQAVKRNSSVVAPPAVAQQYTSKKVKQQLQQAPPPQPRPMPVYNGLGKFRKPSAFAKMSRQDMQALLNKSTSSQEVDFFERVKRVLGNKQSYTEFLKVLNLFNQDVIDAKTLVEKIEPFIGRHEDLFDWFRYYVGQGEETEQLVLAGGEGPPRDMTDLKRSGASYRLLPTDYEQAHCGGRDALAHEVLNDQWICHPTWATEDGGFVAHRKNPYEEALYRCEEERYEFDLSIETNKITIQRLDALIARMEAELINEEERKNFKLKVDEGLSDGMSKFQYKSIIIKVYGQDNGREMVEALHEYPFVAAPIILQRLKQKDEEWRRSQREWQKVWREIDGKNFYKSLDHQGISFKTMDKKVISSKSLISEIEAIYRERFEGADTKAARHHLQYSLPDVGVVEDVRKLILTYLEKASELNTNELDRVQVLLGKMLNGFMGRLQEEASRPNGAVEEDSMEVDPSSKESMSRRVLFGNNAYYLFMRLFQLAYSRLSKIKDSAQRLADSHIGSGFSKLDKQSVAKELDMLTKREGVPVDVVGGDVYHAMLELIDKQFEGKIDATVYEEQARFWFGTSAYVCYTMDKLFHSLCKQLTTIVTDVPCIRLFGLYEENGSQILTADPQSKDALKVESAYRQKADEILDEEENMYQLEFYPYEQVLTIVLLGQDTANILAAAAPTSNPAEARWSEYIDQYVKAGGGKENAKNVILARNLKLSPDQQVKTVARNDLECKISVDTFKMSFVENTEDYYKRFSQIPPTYTDQRRAAWSKHHSYGEKQWSKGLSEGAKKDAEQKAVKLYTDGGSRNATTKKDSIVINGIKRVKYTTTYKN